MRRIRRSLPILLAVAFTVTLSGCADLADAARDAAGQAVDEAVNQVTGDVGAAVGDAIEGAAGGSISIAGLPADWPQAVVIVPGTVTGGAATPTGWTALVTPDGSADVNEAAKVLQNAGFATESSAVSGGLGAITLQSAEFVVTLVGTDAGVLYTIERR